MQGFLNMQHKFLFIEAEYKALEHPAKTLLRAMNETPFVMFLCCHNNISAFLQNGLHIFENSNEIKCSCLLQSCTNN